MAAKVHETAAAPQKALEAFSSPPFSLVTCVSDDVICGVHEKAMASTEERLRGFPSGSGEKVTTRSERKSEVLRKRRGSGKKEEIQSFIMKYRISKTLSWFRFLSLFPSSIFSLLSSLLSFPFDPFFISLRKKS